MIVEQIGTGFRAKLDPSEQFLYPINYDNSYGLIDSVTIWPDRVYISLCKGCLCITADRNESSIPQRIVHVIEWEMNKR